MWRLEVDHTTSSIVRTTVDSLGLDTTPIIIPFRQYGKENQRRLSSLPQFPQVQSAPVERLLLSWWDREISIWRVYGTQPSVKKDDGVGNEVPDRTRRLVAKIAATVSSSRHKNICKLNLMIVGRREHLFGLLECKR